MIRFFRRNKRKRLLSRYTDYKHLRKQVCAYVDLCEYCDSLSGHPEFYVALRKFLDSSTIKINSTIKKEKIDKVFVRKMQKASQTGSVKAVDDLLKGIDIESL